MTSTVSPIAVFATAPTATPSLAGAMIGGKGATPLGSVPSEDVGGAAAGGSSATAKSAASGGDDTFAQALAALFGQTAPQTTVTPTTSLRFRRLDGTTRLARNSKHTFEI